MRKLLLTTAAVAAAIAGAFAAELTHSKNADSSYADYCVRIEESDTTLSIKLLLVKEYRDLEPIRLDTQMQFKCETSFWGSTSYSFDFIEKRVGELLDKLTSSGVWFYGNGWYDLNSQKLNPTQPVVHVSELPIFMVKGRQKEKWKKEQLLLKENTYTNATVSIRFECLPIDTTFQVNYRVRLIGECK